MYRLFVNLDEEELSTVMEVKLDEMKLWLVVVI